MLEAMEFEDDAWALPKQGAARFHAIVETTEAGIMTACGKCLNSNSVTGRGVSKTLISPHVWHEACAKSIGTKFVDFIRKNM